MRNPKFDKLLKRMADLHDKKNSDYAKDGDPFSNFSYAAVVADPFTLPIDKVFATMMAIKMARIAELATGKKPNNEAIEDSRVDLATYAAIWASYHIED